MYSILNTSKYKQCEGQRRQSGSSFLALSFLIAEALIDKIQSDLASHHLSVRKESSVSQVL